MRSRNIFSFFILIMSLFMIGFTSCRKDKIDTGSSVRLSFSTDTVFFDTVFTSTGSVTHRLLVYNNNANKIKVSSIRLSGGDHSFYKINVDGIDSYNVSDIEIAGHDSLFIFVRVTINPTIPGTPFVVTDSIQFTTNGNIQNVKLVAWGQNAWFYKNKRLKGNITWDSLTKPYVIYGELRVDTGSFLTIMPGVKVYLHKGSSLSVSSLASLKINGNLAHPVRFQGDRLDPYYRDLSGQWDGIYLDRGSVKNEINYAIIKNGSFGISVDSVSSPDPMLKIDNTIIRNVTGTGLYAYRSCIVSTNCVFGDCGSAALDIEFGGSYDFRQLTIGNYWGSSVRLSPSLYISNYQYTSTGSKIYNELTKAYFGNCIIDGYETEEIQLDSLENNPFNFTFDHALLKTAKINTTSHYVNCSINKDPKFIDPVTNNLMIDSISPAIQQGIPMGVIYDYNEVNRGPNPDLGAYQFVKKK